MRRTALLIVALCSTVLLLGCSKQQPSSQAVQPETAITPHDPEQGFTAWVFCVDTSRSPREDEFARLKGLIRDTVDREVDFNDLVWVIPIGGGFTTSEPIQMPPRGRTRSEERDSIGHLKKQKDALIAEIDGLQQVAGNTDLKDPVELALSILKSQNTGRKILMIGSDFIQDGARITPAAPPIGKSLSAKDVKVALLLTYPSPAYLNALRLSPNELRDIVTQKWGGYFASLGAANVALGLVDALPGAQQGNVRSSRQ
jgi:hypothetical protein